MKLLLDRRSEFISQEALAKCAPQVWYANYSLHALSSLTAASTVTAAQGRRRGNAPPN